MIKKLSRLYKEGKLNGPLVRRITTNMAANQMKKIAAKPMATSLPSSMESVDALKKLISKSVSPEEVMSLSSKIDDIHTYMSPKTSLADANLILEDVANKAGHMFHPNAKGAVVDAAVSRLSELGGRSKSIGETITRFLHKAGPNGHMALAGGVGLLGVGLGNLLYKKYKEGEADKVLGQVLAENPELDTRKAKDNFDALKTVSPNIALNKAIATGYLNRMNEFDTLDLAPLQAAADIHKSRFSNEEKSNWDYQKEISRALGGSISLT